MKEFLHNMHILGKMLKERAEDFWNENKDNRKENMDSKLWIPEGKENIYKGKEDEDNK